MERLTRHAAAGFTEHFRHVVFPALRRRKPVHLGPAADAPAPGAAPEPAVSEGADPFVRWLFNRAGLDAGFYRPETLRRRLPACLRALGVRSTAQARRVLEQEPARVTTAMSAMLVGVSSLFRDPAVFDALRQEVLPLLAKGRHALAVWSAGCSDGAELYSLAVLLDALDLLAGSYLVGTDCRPDAVSAARVGWFDAAAVKAVPPELLARYFTPHGPGWQVAPAVRACLRWRVADVLKTLEPGIWDVILCRNTTMYMCLDRTEFLWERFAAALRPGGVLVVGKAERPLGARRLRLVGPCIYRRSRG